jgi:GAG-pre-integrase domain
VSATGRLDILHHFTSHTPYEIMGYDGTVTRAAGQGMAYVKGPDQKQLEEMFSVYIPSVDGTIISLEHHTRTHPDIHKWTQEATPEPDTGWVTFQDIKDQVISRYKMKQERGYYYIHELEFYPVYSVQIATYRQQDDDTTAGDALTVKQQTPRATSENCIDYDEDLGRENAKDQVHPVMSWTNPREPYRISMMNEKQMTNTEKDVSNFEIWHQRVAHCSEKRLRQTQKLVDGIPAFHGPKLPPLVTCRTCDLAKLKKAPRGKSMDDSEHLYNG